MRPISFLVVGGAALATLCLAVGAGPAATSEQATAVVSPFLPAPPLGPPRRLVFYGNVATVSRTAGRWILRVDPAAFLSGLADAIVLDIGGTTTDGGVLVGGFPREASFEVSVGGVRTNFRMPDVASVGLGGGSLVGADGATVGPISVGFRLTERARIFGGDALTATDIAVAAGLLNLGEHARVADLDPAVVATARGVMRDRIADLGLANATIGVDSDGYGRLYGYRGPKLSELLPDATVVDVLDEIEGFRKSFEKRRKLVVDGLNALPGVTCRMPGGANRPRQLKKATSSPCSLSVGMSTPGRRSSDETASALSLPASTCGPNSP